MYLEVRKRGEPAYLVCPFSPPLHHLAFCSLAMPRNYPDWLKAYTQFTSASEAPLEFHFWTGVSTIAACLRKRVWRDELYFKWTPNFYIIFVGPAGTVTKSTTLNLGFRLLEKVPGIKFGPDSMTWHGLGKDLAAAFEYFDCLNPQTGQMAQYPMSPITCSVSELGTFLRPDDKALISFLTDVWDGKDRPFRHKTQDSVGIEVQSPWLNIIGATTPEWIQNNFPPSFLSEGIGSRIIFVYAEQKRHHVAYPSRAVIQKDFNAQEAKLVEDLIEISKIKGHFDLTPAAFAWGEQWYKDLQNRPTSLASGRYSSYLARKQTHMHKLAMVLALSASDTLIIDKHHLETANTILSTTEKSMMRVFESVGVVEEAKHLAELIPYVRAYGWLSADDLYKLVFNVMSKKDFLAALHGGINGGLFDVVSRNSVKGVSLKPTSKMN